MPLADLNWFMCQFLPWFISFPTEHHPPQTPKKKNPPFKIKSDTENKIIQRFS